MFRKDFRNFPQTEYIRAGLEGQSVSFNHSFELVTATVYCIYLLAGIFGRYSQVSLYHLRSHLHWILGLYFNYIVDYTRLYWTIHWTTLHHLGYRHFIRDLPANRKDLPQGLHSGTTDSTIQWNLPETTRLTSGHSTHHGNYSKGIL